MWLSAGILTLRATTLVSSKGCTGWFLRFTNRLLHNVCEPHDYYSATNVLNLTLLAKHKRSAGISSFLNGFLINKVDSSSLRLVIRFFGVPTACKSTVPFTISLTVADYSIILVQRNRLTVILMCLAPRFGISFFLTPIPLNSILRRKRLFFYGLFSNEI